MAATSPPESAPARVLRRLSRALWVFLPVLLAVAIVAMVWVGQLAERNVEAAELLTLVGKQRMLLQRIEGYSHQIAELEPGPRLLSLKRNDFTEAVLQTRKNHEDIISRLGAASGFNSPRIMETVFQPPVSLDLRTSVFLAHSEIVLNEALRDEEVRAASLQFLTGPAPARLDSQLALLASQLEERVAETERRMDLFSLGAASLLGLLGFVTLVTSRALLRRLGRRLRQEEQKNLHQAMEGDRCRAMLESAGVCLFELDRRGRISQVNSRAREALGYSNEELLGRNWFDFFAPAEEREAQKRRFREAVSSGGAMFEDEFRVRIRGGRSTLMRWHVTKVGGKGDEDRPVVVAAVDISRQRRAEEEAKCAREAAERANEAKTRFMANLSHDLRSPLNAILGFSELLQEGDGTPEERERYLDLLRRNGEHVLGLIGDLLDLAHIEQGRYRVERGRAPVAELLAGLISTHEQAARRQGLDFQVRSESPLPEWIETDAKRFRQVLDNLVGNAIKYTDAGKVEILARLEGQKLVVDVRDTGRGISVENRERLFRAFERFDESRPGTGLGLAIARRLARLLGGDVELVRSEEENGSVFRFWMDLVQVEGGALLPLIPDNAGWRKAGPSGGGRHRLDGCRVLVVDDSVDNLMLFEHFLTRAGAAVETAETGGEGLERVEGESFDLVLLDIQLPDLSGFEVVRELRRRGYTAPVVALTAHALASEQRESHRAGFDGFLTKPISGAKLVESTWVFIDSARRRKEKAA